MASFFRSRSEGLKPAGAVSMAVASLMLHPLYHCTPINDALDANILSQDHRAPATRPFAFSSACFCRQAPTAHSRSGCDRGPSGTTI